MDLPEEILINIIARLPAESIVRLKLVFREWKSLTESSLFRDIYRSNSNTNTTSSNWSVLHRDPRTIGSNLEEVKLDLPRESRHGNSSFVNGFTQNKDEIKEIRVMACTDGLVLLRLEPEETRCYVGNPVLRQWIQLPTPQYYNSFIDSALVTRMHNGALLGYKVVRTLSQALQLDKRSFDFEIFSSDTGEWSVKQVPRPGDGYMCMASNLVSLNGKLYWTDNARRVIVHDFFSHDDQVRAIRLPAVSEHPFPREKMICTTSQGCFVHINVVLIEEVKSFNVRVWKLNGDSWNWEKAWEINMAYVGLGASCVPMAINCFDIEIIYLWDSDSKCFLAYNHRTGTKSYGARKDIAVYKEDTLCFARRPYLSQFVPSFHIVPT